MKIQLLVTTVILLGGLMFVRAQGEAEYQLREVGAEEFLNAIPSILEQFADETQNDQYQFEYYAMLQSVTRELEMKYADLGTVPYKTLKLADAYIIQNTFSGAEEEWQNWKILAALRESGSDISTLSELRVEDYTIRFKRIDFNADSTDELLLDIQSEFDGYHEYRVLTPDEGTPLGYRRIDTPDLWSSSNCNFRSVCGGDAKTLEVRDVNADGLPEWVIAIGSYCGYGECGGHLEVLGWRHGEIVSLTHTSEFWDLGWTTGAVGGGRSPLLPPMGGWIFENIDQDSALELIQRMTITDNRNCVIKDKRVFDWSLVDDAYIRASLTRDYDNSTGCALRLGHEEMNKGNYPEAIKAYENALQMFASATTLDGYDKVAQQYAQVRLMLAYALNDQSDKALEIRATLMIQIPQSDMANLLEAIQVYTSENDKLSFCIEVNRAAGENNSLSVLDIIGQTADVGKSLNYLGGFNANEAGCNVGKLLEQSSSNLELNHNQTPGKVLSEQGWTVIGEFSADLNDDNLSDWFVWVEQAPLILFISTNTSYEGILQNSFPQKPEENTTLVVHKLSDVQSNLLAEITFGQPDTYDECPNRDQMGSLYLWYWDMDKKFLRSIAGYPLCEPKTLDDIFPQPGVLQAWSYSRVASNILVPTTFLWNTQSQSFEVTVQATPAPLPVISATTETNVVTEPCYQNPYEHCGFSGSGEELLAQLDATIRTPPENEYAFFLTVAHYYRALTLEALNRPDEALADYVSIYTAAPESAWGRLAALHIECVAHC